MKESILMINKHGEGTYSWKSGSYYKGSFYNDQRHGYGEMFWIDGSSYKGQWEKGSQKGEGVMTYADGTIKRGTTGTFRSLNNKEFHIPQSHQPNFNKAEKEIYSELSYSTTQYNNESGFENNLKSFLGNEKNIYRRPNLMNSNTIYHSKSHSKSDILPSRDKYETSSYSQDEDSFINNSLKKNMKNKLRIKLIQHTNLQSAGNVHMSQIDESIRNPRKQYKYDNFMKMNKYHHDSINLHNYAENQSPNKNFNQLDYDSGVESIPRRHYNSPGNKVLASSHYSIQPRNRSFDLRRENRINTGNRSSGYVYKQYSRYNNANQLTTEPSAVIKIIRNNRNK